MAKIEGSLLITMTLGELIVMNRESGKAREFHTLGSLPREFARRFRLSDVAPRSCYAAGAPFWAYALTTTPLTDFAPVNGATSYLPWELSRHAAALFAGEVSTGGHVCITAPPHAPDERHLNFIDTIVHAYIQDLMLNGACPPPPTTEVKVYDVTGFSKDGEFGAFNANTGCFDPKLSADDKAAKFTDYAQVSNLLRNQLEAGFEVCNLRRNVILHQMTFDEWWAANKPASQK